MTPLNIVDIVMVVWPTVNGAAHINEVTLCQAWLVLDWATVVGALSWDVISQPSQLSLLPLAGWKMSTGQQGCGLGFDVSVSRQSRDVSTSRLGLVSTKIVNISVSSRSRPLTARARDPFSPKFCRSQ